MKFLKGIVCGIAITLSLLVLVFSVYAAVTEKTISAAFNDIKIILNGNQLDLKDENGNDVEPFIVNGTTYVPIRAISENFNKVVFWDDKTNSVFIRDNGIENKFEFDLENKILNVVYIESGNFSRVENVPIKVNDDGRIFLPSNKELPIYDLTTDETWNKMGINVFGYVGNYRIEKDGRIIHLDGGFIYKNGKRIDLPMNYMCLAETCVADLNNDSEYELLYLSKYSWTDGRKLNCYSEKTNIACDISCSSDSKLIKNDDYNVSIDQGHGDIDKLKIEKQGEKYVLTSDRDERISREWYDEVIDGFNMKDIADEVKNSKAMEEYRVIFDMSFYGYDYYSLKVFNDGTGQFHYMIHKSEDFNTGEIVLNITKNLTVAETQTLLECINKNDFWNIPTIHPEEELGCDGTTTFIEGYKNGQRHFINMWEPEEHYGIYKIRADFSAFADRVAQRPIFDFD